MLFCNPLVMSDLFHLQFTLSRSRRVALISNLFYLMLHAVAGPHALTACRSLPGWVFLFNRNNKSIRQSNERKNIGYEIQNAVEKFFFQTFDGKEDITWLSGLLLKQVWTDSCECTYSCLVSETLSQVTSVSSPASFTPPICRLPLGVEMPFSFTSLCTKILKKHVIPHKKVHIPHKNLPPWPSTNSPIWGSFVHHFHARNFLSKEFNSDGHEQATVVLVAAGGVHDQEHHQENDDDDSNHASFGHAAAHCDQGNIRNFNHHQRCQG